MKTDIIKLNLWWKEAHDLLSDSRKEAKEAKEAKEYYHGRQIPSDVLAVLSSRGQPIMWENQYKKIGNKLMGFKIAQRQDIAVNGRQQEDKTTAYILRTMYAADGSVVAVRLNLYKCDVMKKRRG